MLGDNIKKYRKERGYTQEALAAELNVVRQTLSKWENNISVPDAGALIALAGALGVTVNALLDVSRDEPPEDLAEELARVNAELAERNRQIRRNALAGRKRGLLILLSFAALIVVLTVRNKIVSLAAVGVCAALSLLILYRNLPLLSAENVTPVQMKVLKAATVMSAVVMAALILLCVLLQAEAIVLTENRERRLLIGIFACVFLFFGLLSTWLPFQRHTGLRLPWTVSDEETWNIAHKVIGVISVPITVLYIAAACAFSDVDSVAKVSVAALIAFIGIPAVISLVFYWRKYHGLGGKK